MKNEKNKEKKRNVCRERGVPVALSKTYRRTLQRQAEVLGLLLAQKRDTIRHPVTVSKAPMRANAGNWGQFLKTSLKYFKPPLFFQKAYFITKKENP